MALNKVKGNMYEFVTHTFNIIKGRCPHLCEYCYMLPIWGRQKSTRQFFDEKELKTKLFDNAQECFIFVGSSTDMFANNVPREWIEKTLEHCKKFPENKYLFQTKNPKKFVYFDFPRESTLCTTIETNRKYSDTKAPDVWDRAYWLSYCGQGFDRMVTIEPIMDFDLREMIYLIRKAEPTIVNIGADSKNHNLPEPSAEKIKSLIAELEKFTIVKKKKNLDRLIEKK